MSPLDDELRATLRSRADVLAPSPDPLAGIEERARGIRRRRTAVSVLGAGLAVAAIAFAVPSVLPTKDAAGDRFANPTPSSTPAASYDLDPAHPWAPRGTVSPAAVEKARLAWEAKHPGTTFSVIFGQRYEPSQQDELAFVSNGPNGARYGFVSGSSFLYDEQLGSTTGVLAFQLPGDELGRALLVAAPQVRSFTKETGTTRTGMTALAEGVAISPVELGATFTVVAPDGTVLFDGPLPPHIVSPAKPANLLDWPPRGAMESDLMPRAKSALAPSLDASADEVELRVLFAGSTDSGVEYLMGQAWKEGAANAYPFSYAEGGTKNPRAFLGANVFGKTGQAALVFLVQDLPGTSVDHLVVIPVPGTGQVSYDDDGAGSFHPVTGQDHLDGVVIIDRAKSESDDRLEILDGNGDLDRPTYRGEVAPFLCPKEGCS